MWLFSHMTKVTCLHSHNFMKIEINKIYNMDCLEGMKYIEDKSIDMILCDLPYGTTRLKWDSAIPLKPLWEQYERIIKNNGAIVLFGSEPFSSIIRTSNLILYKYDWVWEKNTGSNFLQANYQPIKRHENIMVFSKYNASYTKNNKKMNYFPIFNEEGKVYANRPEQNIDVALNAWEAGVNKNYKLKRDNNKGTFPVSVLKFPGILSDKLHPTQKPVDLCEYLIKTYTNENELVLDNCIGSGTTAIACINTNRNYIGFDNGIDDRTGRYWADIANERIRQHIRQ